MLHITATLHHTTLSGAIADAEPSATVTGVYDSEAIARMHRSIHRGEAVLPISHAAGTSHRPVVGETLPTTREASGLVAVVLP